DLIAADLAAAVPAFVVAAVVDRIPPGQCFEPAVERGLVGLDDEQEGADGGDDVPGVLGLCVQGVGGGDHCGQVQAGQQGCEGGDLVARVLDLPLGEHALGVVPDGGQQVSPAVAGAAAAQSLAVHGQAEQGCSGGSS